MQTLYSASGCVWQNCHVLVMTLYSLNLPYQHIIEGNLKLFETNYKFEDIT